MKKKIIYSVGIANLILVSTGLFNLNIFDFPVYYIILSPIISISLIIISIIFKVRKAIWISTFSLLISLWLFVILANTPW